MAGKIFVVTGANKGIGYAIVRNLAQKVEGGFVYLTARNPQLGEASLKSITDGLGNKALSQILFHQLDITDEQSCQKFADNLKQKHGQIDVLINNAGYAFSRDATDPPEEQANVTLAINYYGTKRITQCLDPLIRNGGRIVVLASQNGIMGKGIFSTMAYSDKWIQYMSNKDITEQQIDEFVEKYRQACKNDDRKEQGYPESAYRVSKTAEIAYSLLLSKKLQSRKITVNACCPGYVDTDMTNHKGPLSIDEGADTPVYLATSPDAPSGEFVYQRKPIPWY